MELGLEDEMYQTEDIRLTIFPYTSAELRISGRMSGGIPKNLKVKVHTQS